MHDVDNRNIEEEEIAVKSRGHVGEFYSTWRVVTLCLAFQNVNRLLISSCCDSVYVQGAAKTS